MKRLYSNVGSTKAALQERPEVLDSVGVNLTFDIPLNMVDYFMGELIGQSVAIRGEVIGNDLRSTFKVIENLL